MSFAAILATFGFAFGTSADIVPNTFSDGTHQVGVDIAPGTYVVEIDDGICSVGITDADGQDRNPTFIGRAIVTITSRDKVIETSGCGNWELRQRSFASAPSSRFGPGMHEIGVDIRPGVYTASNDDGRCVWFMVDDFRHRPALSNLITWWKTDDPLVEIKPDDVGFYSIRCGTWDRRDADLANEPLTRFPDGSYLVGVDIAPGTYFADAGEEQCNWFRTAPFGDTSPDDSGGYVSKGRQIASILVTDTGFHSSGCGVWEPFALESAEIESGGSIGAGTAAMGVDMQPGVYVAEAIDDGLCQWFTLNGFAGRPVDVIAPGHGIVRGIVDLTPNVVGFRSINCSDWKPLASISNVDATDRFGDGEHVVNVHVEPGIYASPGAEPGRCTWRRLAHYGNPESAQIAARNPVGRNIAEISSDDAVFQSFGCGIWERFTPVKDDNLIDTFGHGTWAVNSDIRTGTYVSEVPDGSTCFWSRLSAFTGEPADFATSDLTVRRSVTTVKPFDVGFYSDGCGVWNLARNVAASESAVPTTNFADGIYIVNRDISPGTYVSTGVEGEICFWSRLTGFDSDSFSRLNTYASEGPAIATILSSDAGFRSFGCGEWHAPDDRTSTETFSNGTFEVGVDIEPGTYIASDAPRATCRWRRLSDFTWTSGTIIETIASGQKIVTIRGDDVGFASYGCGEWKEFVGDEHAPIEPPPSRFTGGSYVVGMDIEPGTYYAVPRRGGGCRWRRVNDFSGDPDDTIAEGDSDDRWIVRIDASDSGFVTHGCGIWRNLEIALKIGPYSEFDDGAYRVGRDIVAGTYVADVPVASFINGRPVPSCRWQKVSSFSHELPDVIATGGGRGRIEVTLTDSDVGFVSSNCEIWRLRERPANTTD